MVAEFAYTNGRIKGFEEALTLIETLTEQSDLKSHPTIIELIEIINKKIGDKHDH